MSLASTACYVTQQSFRFQITQHHLHNICKQTETTNLILNSETCRKTVCTNNNNNTNTKTHLSMHFQGPNFVAAERNIKQQTAKKINYKRILVGAFLDAKSLIKLSRSILSNVSLSRHNIAKPSDFSSEIDELK